MRKFRPSIPFKEVVSIIRHRLGEFVYNVKDDIETKRIIHGMSGLMKPSVLTSWPDHAVDANLKLTRSIAKASYNELKALDAREDVAKELKNAGEKRAWTSSNRTK